MLKNHTQRMMGCASLRTRNRDAGRCAGAMPAQRGSGSAERARDGMLAQGEGGAEWTQGAMPAQGAARSAKGDGGGKGREGAGWSSDPLSSAAGYATVITTLSQRSRTVSSPSVPALSYVVCVPGAWLAALCTVHVYCLPERSSTKLETL